MPQVVKTRIADVCPRADFVPEFLDVVKWLAGSIAGENVRRVLNCRFLHGGEEGGGLGG